MKKLLVLSLLSLFFANLCTLKAVIFTNATLNEVEISSLSEPAFINLLPAIQQNDENFSLHTISGFNHEINVRSLCFLTFTIDGTPYHITQEASKLHLT